MGGCHVDHFSACFLVFGPGCHFNFMSCTGLRELRGVNVKQAHMPVVNDLWALNHAPHLPVLLLSGDSLGLAQQEEQHRSIRMAG